MPLGSSGIPTRVPDSGAVCESAIEVPGPRRLTRRRAPGHRRTDPPRLRPRVCSRTPPGRHPRVVARVPRTGDVDALTVKEFKTFDVWTDGIPACVGSRLRSGVESPFGSGEVSRVSRASSVREARLTPGRNCRRFQKRFQSGVLLPTRATNNSRNLALWCGFVDGSDGTRTRDLRRDRPAF